MLQRCLWSIQRHIDKISCEDGVMEKCNDGGGCGQSYSNSGSKG